MTTNNQTDNTRRDSDYRALRSTEPADHWVQRALDEQRQQREKAS